MSEDSVALEEIKKRIQEKETAHEKGALQRKQLLEQRDQLNQQLVTLEQDLFRIQGEHKALVDLVPEEKPPPKKPELTTVKDKEKKKK